MNAKHVAIMFQYIVNSSTHGYGRRVQVKLLQSLVLIFVNYVTSV